MEQLLADSLVTPPKVSQLPKDPHEWTADQVQVWLEEFASRNLITSPPARLPYDGKTICAIPLPLFLLIVPQSAYLLYFDLRKRILRCQQEDIAQLDLD